MKRKQCDYYGNATRQRHVISLRSRAETGGESRATALDSPPVSALDRREITRVISLVILLLRKRASKITAKLLGLQAA